MTNVTEESPSSPWPTKAAFALIAVGFFSTQGLLAFSIYKGWVWLVIPLVLLVSHFMHGYLIAFHEAAHGLLRKNKTLNEIDGIIMGTFSLTSFTLYRALHQKHHAHLATEKDIELWPFVDTSCPRWKRQLAAFLELNFGLFYTPYLFWRLFFSRSSPIRSPKVRTRIWLELALGLVVWGITFAMTITFNLWPFLLLNYVVPAFIAGNLQSWRKFIEHVGLSGHSARSATRSIIADTWAGKLVSLTLLHEPLHGIHHIKSSLPHSDLPTHVEWLEATEEGDTDPFPNYWSAFLDLLRCLPDPRVGRQWENHKVALKA
jgi:fatty acid desaturase